MTDTSTSAPEEETLSLPGDGLREGIVDELRRRIGEALVDSELRPNDDLWVRVDEVGAERVAQEADDALAEAVARKRRHRLVDALVGRAGVTQPDHRRRRSARDGHRRERAG